MLDRPTAKTTTIYIRFTHRKKTYRRTTSLRIQPENWDKKRKLPKMLNDELIEIKDKLERLEIEMRVFLNTPRTEEEILNKYTELKSAWSTPILDTKNNSQYFWDIYQKFLDHSEAVGTRARVIKYRSVRNQLERICDESGIQMSFGRINIRFFDIWLGYYLKHNFSPKTAHRYWKMIKTFMKWSWQRKYHAESGWDFKTPKIKNQSSPKEILYLEIEEMDKLYNAEFTGNQKLVRDMFILSCYTGLRVSDIKKLRVEHIVGDKIFMDTQKDQDEVEIPIYAKPLIEILKEYTEEKESGLVFPGISDQKGNDNLKKIALAVELKRSVKVMEYEKFVRTPKFKPVHKVLTWHWGRRSFVMQSIKRGMLASDIAKITGHSSVEAMKPYFTILQESVNESMRKAYSE